MMPPKSRPLYIKSDATRRVLLSEPGPVCHDYGNPPGSDIRFVQILHSPTRMLTGFIPLKVPSAATTNPHLKHHNVLKLVAFQRSREIQRNIPQFNAKSCCGELNLIRFRN